MLHSQREYEKPLPLFQPTLFLREIFHHKAPTVTRFHSYVKEKVMPKEQPAFLFGLYRIAFFAWDELTEEYRRFFIHLAISHRQELLDYLNDHTFIGSLLSVPFNKQRLIKFMHLYLDTLPHTRVSFRKTAFALLLGFDFHLSVDTLADQLRSTQMDSDDLIGLYSKIHLSDIDDM